MLGLIDGQLYELTPATITNGEYRIGLDADGVMKAYIGDHVIKYGVNWRSFNKCVDVHPKTGEITVNSPGFAKIRGIFYNQHRDFNLDIQAPEARPDPDVV